MFDVFIANFTLKSAIFRRSVRTAIAVIIAVYIAQKFALIKGYWLPMTTAIVMDLTVGGALRKGFHRIIGTLVGVMVATGILYAGLDYFWLNAIFLLSVFIAYYLKYYNVTNYGFFAFTTTVMILILYQLIIPFPEIYFFPRLYETVIGALIGIMMSMVILPNRTMALQKEKLTSLIRKYKEFFQHELSSLTISQEAHFCRLTDTKVEIMDMLVVNRELQRMLRYESFINRRNMRLRAYVVFLLERIGHLALSSEATVDRLFSKALDETSREFLVVIHADLQQAFSLMLLHVDHEEVAQQAIRKETVYQIRGFIKHVDQLAQDHASETVVLLRCLLFDLRDLFKILRKLDHYLLRTA